MNYLSWDVDFNATIKEASRLNDEYITKKLYDRNFFIIGVYEDEELGYKISAFKKGKNPMFPTKLVHIIRRDGSVVKIRSLNKLSWKEWISCMSETYAIDSSKIVSANAKRTARLVTKFNTDLVYWWKKNNKVGKQFYYLCKKFGVEPIRCYKNEFGDSVEFSPNRNFKYGLELKFKNNLNKFIMKIGSYDLLENEVGDYTEIFDKYADFMNELNKLDYTKIPEYQDLINYKKKMGIKD